jgi:hypothetical protein
MCPVAGCPMVRLRYERQISRPRHRERLPFGCARDESDETRSDATRNKIRSRSLTAVQSQAGFGMTTKGKGVGNDGVRSDFWWSRLGRGVVVGAQPGLAVLRKPNRGQPEGRRYIGALPWASLRAAPTKESGREKHSFGGESLWGTRIDA